MQWGRYLAGPQQNAGGTMSMGIHSWAMEGVLVIVTQTFLGPGINPDEDGAESHGLGGLQG